MEWQPIETAPKDGKRILLLGDGERHADGVFLGGDWVWPYIKSQPKYWTKLPPAPTE